jgi:hypothetical protein
MNEIDRLLEVQVVAKRLAVCPRTIRRMILDPGSPLRGVRVYQRHYRVIASSVEDLLRDREIRPEDN